MNFNFCLIVGTFILNSAIVNGLKFHQRKLRKPKSRSDIPIDERDYDSFEEELNHDLDRFKIIQKKIYQIRKLLKFKNQTHFSTENLHEEIALVKKEDEIELLKKDLNEIEQIVKSLGENLTEQTSKDMRKMLKDASVFLNKLENQFRDVKSFGEEENGANLDDDPDEVEEPDDLPDELQPPTLEEYSWHNLPYHFDKESAAKYGRKPDVKTPLTRVIGADLPIESLFRHSSKAVFDKEEEIRKDDANDPLVILAIVVAILIVIVIILVILVKNCCCRSERLPPNHKSFGYTDDFEKEEDIYLEDFGEGEFFEWPMKSDVKTSPLQLGSYQERQMVVEYSKGFESYCRLTTNPLDSTNL